MDDACTEGALSDEAVRSQIDILNEGFLALQGTPGASGQNSQIRFELASETPEGQPSSGITRNCNSAWYQALSWNPARYLNIYTNTASGARGFNVIPPWLDGGALVGSAEDRIVVNHLVFGRDAAFPPHDQGRTATHEVGHYLGLMHPYFGGCGLPGVPDCYRTGDLICDTPPDAQSHDQCPLGALSCGGFAVPIENYMELTDDLCMTGFTAEQVQRMRCTLLTYRQDLLEAGAIFGDGFESGDLSAWS